jgi:signal transduction histidine kinase
MIDSLDDFTARLTAFIERERTFTRDASHELRTPLAVLKGSLDRLQRDADRPAQERDALARMRRTTTDMGALIEMLLLLAREDEVDSASEPVTVNEIVAEELEMLGALAQRSQNQLRVNEHASLGVQAPRKAVGIVLSNLLRNALSYTRDGVVEVDIHDRGVRIRDTGIGMSQDDAARAFEPFFRADSARETDAARGNSGHGLGLSIVRRLCNQYGWTIAVESTRGEGTAIDISFS